MLAHESTVVGKFGQADTIVLDLPKIYPVISQMFRDNPRIFLEA